MIRVLVVDDHEVFRSAITKLLGSSPGIEVCGEATDGREAVTLVRSVRPDVVLLDLRMPGAGGLDALSALDAADAARVVVLSAAAERAQVQSALAAGAAGYLVKGCPAVELLDAVRAVADAA